MMLALLVEPLKAVAAKKISLRLNDIGRAAANPQAVKEADSTAQGRRRMPRTQCCAGNSPQAGQSGLKLGRNRLRFQKLPAML